MEEDKSTRFSPSKLGTYQGCPRQYRYRYIDKIKREVQTVEAFLGQCVHKAFEALYEGLLHGRALSEEEAIGVFEREWEAGFSEVVLIREKEYSPQDWRNLGRECLRAYYREQSPFTRERTVGVEKRVSFPLKAGEEEYLIEGFIDRLALAPDGAFEIHDYKTGRSLPTQEELDRDWQLALYELAVRHAWPDTQRVRLLWHYVRYGKTLVSTRTPEELEDLKRKVAALIQVIKRDHEFAPRKSPLCDWCEYRKICPLWSHAERVSRMPEEELRRDEGVRLVRELAAIDAEKRGIRQRLRELEADQEALEGLILRFAEAQGISAVSVCLGEAATTEREEYRFPTRTHAPQALEALERELKESPLWKEVSHLDAHRLLEGYRRREWPPEILQFVETLLARHAKRILEKTVRFHRKRALDEE